ncbi:homoserine O-succinyltransferase [uncultured Dialister sp.]|uniref:homoserine O-succinyltransferase n=1 Tax=uncultured Dialister sp. TaxID=278064 RepID=UPI0025D6E0F9|nr:homoserine O-succinyltransferase [uncultured Dialister sp.]
MPIRIPDGIEAIPELKKEGIVTIGEERARTQDIRPLKILILNLMPIKKPTEVQLLRLLGDSPLQINVDFARIASRETTHTDRSYLEENYLTFDEIKDRKYDGFIITGAPVEKMAYEEVEYWPEMLKYFEWADTHVFSTLHLCWAAQAGLYRDYGVQKKILPKKFFGVYQYNSTMAYHPLLRGFDDRYFIPVSRHTSIDDEAVDNCPELDVLSRSSNKGINIISDKESRRIFILGHFEYDLGTLSWEYKRDKEKGLPIRLPENYYPYDDPLERPRFVWCSYAHLFYHNWVNFVYQETPYSLDNLMPFDVHNPLHER